MTGKEVDKWVEKKILSYGAGIAYYEPEVNFPGSICISVNDELIHGIPKDIPFEEGDKISYDLVIKYHGYYDDNKRRQNKLNYQYFSIHIGHQKIYGKSNRRKLCKHKEHSHIGYISDLFP